MGDVIDMSGSGPANDPGADTSFGDALLLLIEEELGEQNRLSQELAWAMTQRIYYVQKYFSDHPPALY